MDLMHIFFVFSCKIHHLFCKQSEISILAGFNINPLSCLLLNYTNALSVYLINQFLRVFRNCIIFLNHLLAFFVFLVKHRFVFLVCLLLFQLRLNLFHCAKDLVKGCNVAFSFIFTVFYAFVQVVSHCPIDLRCAEVHNFVASNCKTKHPGF